MTYFLSNELLKVQIEQLPSDEIRALAANIGASSFASADQIVRELSRMGANSFVNEVIRDAEAEPASYLSLIRQCAHDLGADVKVRAQAQLIVVDKYPHAAVEFAPEITAAIAAWEEALLGSVFRAVYDSMTTEQRSQFAANVAQLSPSDGKKLTPGLLAAGGALVLGNLGGFGTYMAMSSLLSTLSFGTLGFGAYTAASSLLSIALGPVGWAALGAVVVSRLGAPDKAKLMKAVASVALAAQSRRRIQGLNDTVRARVLRGREAQLWAREKSRDDSLARRQRLTAAPIPKGLLDRFISSAKAGLSSYQESRELMLEGLEDEQAKRAAEQTRNALGRREVGGGRA